LMQACLPSGFQKMRTEISTRMLDKTTPIASYHTMHEHDELIDS
jgi:hypothetical protein